MAAGERGLPLLPGERMPLLSNGSSRRSDRSDGRSSSQGEDGQSIAGAKILLGICRGE